MIKIEFKNGSKLEVVRARPNIRPFRNHIWFFDIPSSGNVC